MVPTDRTENRLARETSPYLRQHRFDPVDWYPWGEVALGRARELDRPLFLSIGYSACHWCHVMAHESFSDRATAALMNESVVAVKIDREERPDVDSVYMEAVQAASGHGGWPMSIFATPDGRPFFAGTYFPPVPRHGTPAFAAVLEAVRDAWKARRADIEQQADQLVAAVAERSSPPPSVLSLDGASEHANGLTAEAVRDGLVAACTRLASIFDAVHGGFGEAPKFPQPLLLDLLLRAHVAGVVVPGGPQPLEMVSLTLETMASGGMYDQVGGGFSRYSVDRSWLVPHFEKMLYDEALLARVYLHAWQVTGDERWRQILDETLGYVLSDLAHPSGALASAEDADSEGEEGRFYVWSEQEVADAVGPELAEEASTWYGVTSAGNFEGLNILFRANRGDLARPPEIELARTRLLSARSKRVRPGLDDKVLTEWNAMACSVLAETAGATGEVAYKEAAERIMVVLLTELRRSDGRVLRSLRAGEDQILGFSADVAWLLEACVRLFELTGQSRYLGEADALASQLLSVFVDGETGGLFTTG
ncbi:MAG: thioredoxin domain-containing protein, partial [Acidimicrobiales bacterium]